MTLHIFTAALLYNLDSNFRFWSISAKYNTKCCTFDNEELNKDLKPHDI